MPDTETSQPRIEEALAIVQREIEYLEAELSAFRRFRAKLVSIEPKSRPADTVDTPLGVSSAVDTTHSGPDTQLRAVREAYRETVMSVPHFEVEYDDSLKGSISAEFSPELGTQIAKDGHLTPQMYEALLTASKEARDDRSTLLAVLNRERESLQSVQDKLDTYEPCVATLGTNARQTNVSAHLESIDNRLADIKAECETVAATRQQHIHNRSTALLSGIDETSLMQYLYDNCSVMCPALADIVACLTTIRTHRRYCLLSADGY